jgi:hypothetical protein
MAKARLAATNKCLAQSNKSGGRAAATNAVNPFHPNLQKKEMKKLLTTAAILTALTTQATADELRAQRAEAQRQYEDQRRAQLLRPQRDEAQRQYEDQLERYKQALRDAEMAQRERHQVWCNRLSQRCAMNWSTPGCRLYEDSCGN